jgi:hypothetical protein
VLAAEGEFRLLKRSPSVVDLPELAVDAKCSRVGIGNEASSSEIETEDCHVILESRPLVTCTALKFSQVMYQFSKGLFKVA